MRTFCDSVATRERAPLLFGLVGPSGTGKTFSALRLATGVQRVVGGDIFMIDSEARRGLYYADRFKFRHVPFGAPFSPLDYLQAFEHCVKQGAKTIIIDSMSHEHEGPGGVLEMHAAEVLRMSRGDASRADKVKMLAWHKPKSDRRRLINTLLQMQCNFIFCFRAKPKIKIVTGREPEPLGYMPIAGDDYVYEMAMKCLLLPGANGVPVFKSDYEGERAMIKIPEQFRAIFAQPKQLSEDIGEALARWAEGSVAAPEQSTPELLKRYAACSDPATLRTIEEDRKRAWAKASREEKESLKAAADEARDAIAAANAAPPVKFDSETGEVREPGQEG